MYEALLQLIVLFFVIFDPLASFSVFFSATKKMNEKARDKIAMLSVLVAAGISLAVLLFGKNLLQLFNTTLDEFKIAGGIILAILGVKMALGNSLEDFGKTSAQSSVAIAAIIGTPLLTGPAAITAIIVSVQDYGMPVTALAVSIVLSLTAILFYQAGKLNKFIGGTFVRVISTILGMVTLAWGVKFIAEGIRALFIVS